MEKKEVGPVREAYDIVLAQQQLRAREAVRAQQHRAQEAVMAQQHRAQETVVIQKHRAQKSMLSQKHKAQLALFSFQPEAQKKLKLRQQEAHDALMIKQGEALGAVLARHREAREKMHARHRAEREEIIARHKLGGDLHPGPNQRSILGSEAGSRSMSELDAAPVAVPELDSTLTTTISIPELDSTSVSIPEVQKIPRSAPSTPSTPSASEPLPKEKNISPFSDPPQLKDNILTLLVAAEEKILGNEPDRSQALDHDSLARAGVDAKYLSDFQDLSAVKDERRRAVEEDKEKLGLFFWRLKRDGYINEYEKWKDLFEYVYGQSVDAVVGVGPEKA